MRKNVLVLMMVVVLVGMLTACGSGKKWLGTYGGTSSNGDKVEITISKKGVVHYNDEGEITVGKWTENENSINLDFGGEVSSDCEPLIVTLTNDESMIVVESADSSWSPDFYQRR